jgi:hypothetical protein
MIKIDLKNEANALLAALSVIQAAAGQLRDDGMVVVDELGQPVAHGESVYDEKGRGVKLIGAIAPRGLGGYGRAMVEVGGEVEILTLNSLNLFWFDAEELAFAE